MRRRRRRKSTASNFVYCLSKQTNDKRIKRRKKYPISFHHYYVCYRIDFIYSLSIPSFSLFSLLLPIKFFSLLLMCHSHGKSLLFIRFIFREEDRFALALCEMFGFSPFFILSSGKQQNIWIKCISVYLADSIIIFTSIFFLSLSPE